MKQLKMPGALIIIFLALVLIGAGLLSNPGSPGDLRSMAETWAEALKTRDGGPRYEIMSEKMREQFIGGQKLRSEPWNYNIGVSSPWVTDYEITIHGNSAEILYHLTDSTQQRYDKKEVLLFGKENGKTVVIEATELLSEWELTPKKTSIEAEDWNTVSYEFDQLLYLSPLSSMTFDYAENRMKGTKYTIGDEQFEIDYPERDDYVLQDPVYMKEAMTDDMIRTFENATMKKVLISEYTTKYRYTIYTKDNQKTNYHLYVLDDELWLSSYADNTADKSEIVMYLWKLK